MRGLAQAIRNKTAIRNMKAIRSLAQAIRKKTAIRKNYPGEGSHHICSNRNGNSLQLTACSDVVVIGCTRAARNHPDGIRKFELTSLVVLLIYTRVCFFLGLGLFIRASREASFCWNYKSTHCSSTKMAIDSRSPWFDVAKLQFVEKPTGSVTDVSPRLMMSPHTHCL